MEIKDLEKKIFYFILFFIPSNLAKHWIQDWSYVNGILIDYLIPSLYLTDILILLLFLAWVYKKRVFKHKKGIILLAFLLLASFIIANILIAYNKPAAIYKWLKIFIFTWLGWWIKTHINIKKDINDIVKVLSLSVIWQSVLAICQWIKQGSIFGYWFFGEQPFSPIYLGIKKISFFGQIRIVPMGTFPHPNVLAGFLVISLLLILFSGKTFSLLLNSISLGLGLIALGLTFSVSGWIGLILGLVMLKIMPKLKNKKRLLFYGLIILLISASVWGLEGLKRSNLNSSVKRRIELNEIALKMWRASPVLGVGLNNFIPRMEEFGRVSVNYRFLQPVHNIFLLLLAETGIAGVILGLGIIYWVLKRRSNQSLSPVYLPAEALAKAGPLLFTVYCLLGSFDHYFLTIQQGLLLTTLVWAIPLPRLLRHPRPRLLQKTRLKNPHPKHHKKKKK